MHRGWMSAALVGVLLTMGCDAEERKASKNAEVRANAKSDQAGTRRCGDFLSAKEAKELGVEEYREGKGDENPLRGLVCTTHPVVLTIFMADQFPRMLGGAKALKGMKETEGPQLGKEAFWFNALEAEQVMFISDSGNYAFGVSGADKDLVIKAAKMASEGR